MTSHIEMTATMGLQFEDEWDRKVYVQWTQALLPVFGERMTAHGDLYEATHARRIEHNGVYGEGGCTAWPSPPYQAPMWPLVAALMSPLSFLEIGCALGYNLALMASAGDRQSTVHGIEIVASHAALAEAAIASRGLAQRVQVFAGDSTDVLPCLAGPYDVIFVDSGGREVMQNDLMRLTGQRGVVVDKEPLRAEVEKLVELLETTSLKGVRDVERVHAEVERRYEAAVRKGLAAL
jgi:predicted O-methyltransferase YrrM